MNKGNLEKVKDYLKKLENGNTVLPDGFTLVDWHNSITVHDSIVVAGFATTVNKSVADLYEKFGFRVVENGIGWKVTDNLGY